LFGVQVAADDVGLLREIQVTLGAGSIRLEEPRKAHWKRTAIYSVKSIKAHVTSTLPFMDRYLLPCAKRMQYFAWRENLDAYVKRHRVRWGMGRSTCSEVGCDQPVRGRGLCRSHYYRETGW
jgi:hypothetical protein